MGRWRNWKIGSYHTSPAPSPARMPSAAFTSRLRSSRRWSASVISSTTVRLLSTLLTGSRCRRRCLSRGSGLLGCRRGGGGRCRGGGGRCRVGGGGGCRQVGRGSCRERERV